MDLCFAGLLETGCHKREAVTALSLAKFLLDGISLTRFNPFKTLLFIVKGPASFAGLISRCTMIQVLPNNLDATAGASHELQDIQARRGLQLR